jgi:hypothetical protein
MKKIAVLDFSIYDIGGDSVWVRHFMAGLKEMPDVELTWLRFKVSRGQDAVRLPKDIDKAREILTQFDAIFPSETKCFTLPIERWLPMLVELPGRVVTGMHGRTYAKGPGLDNRIEQWNACRLVSDGYWETHESFTDNLPEITVPIEILRYLPYKAINPASHVQPIEAALAGRIDPPKGQYMAAVAAQHCAVPVTLWGSVSGTFGGISSSQRLHEKLRRMGYTNYGDDVAPAKFSQWGLWTPDKKNTVSYRGRYEYLTEERARWEYGPFKNAAVALNLTQPRVSPGHIEYTTLEAIDAGVRPLVYENTVENLSYGTSMISVRDDTTPYEIGQAIDKAVKEHVKLYPAEREWLLHHHDPVAYAIRLVEFALSIPKLQTVRADIDAFLKTSITQQEDKKPKLVQESLL